MTLFFDIRSGDRAALAKAITLIESTRADHQEDAQQLLAAALPYTGKSIRLGITGVPGVGKSTFIETFGQHVIAKGHKLAVMAVDPSSAVSGGSILGDKTRMAKLTQDANAFIRPSPTSGSLGGVARRTREAMLLCEAAGYDVIVVETVGVGQSEIEVADMVDMFLLMLLPGSGDGLQGIKKGIVELADLLIVNKADGDQLAQAKRVRADYAAAMKLLQNKPQVMTCSALHGDGISEIWNMVEAYRKETALDARRAEQAKSWMWKEIREALFRDFLQNPNVIKHISILEDEVKSGKKTAVAAASELMKRAKKTG